MTINELQSNTEPITNEQAIQHLSNAIRTAVDCHGHTKTEMNARKVESYKQLLTERGITIPADNELFAAGVFNGPGSW